ncbi:reverse transcriptase [Phytophthora megakarya]|uniref:Reverse transcriptase n=1 Tax=Phytophthora megakarya TaxID=4795 RepID=A0A225VMW8_9STRA|nr:reverse transcriptase [Phytophthora megakarya]
MAKWATTERLWIWKRKILPKWIRAGAMPIDPSVRSKPRSRTTPILRHFDPDRRATVVVYASDWAISGSLKQEYDQIYYTLRSNELNYGIAEKEVLALLRILDLNYNALIGRPIHVLTRHSTLTWLFRSTALQGRLGQGAALLLPWTLEITKCVKGEDEILGALAVNQKWKMFGSIAMNYEVDQLDLVFYCPTTKETAAARDKLMRLVVPETLQQDILHHYHTSLQGSHQGVGRTCDRIRDHFHWRGLYKSVQRYVWECVDCETGKGRPQIQGKSPGNLQSTYPF